MSADGSIPCHLIGLLTPDAIGINLRVKVISKLLTISTQTPEGTNVSWTELLVGDESGCIALQGRTEALAELVPGSVARMSGLMTVVDADGHMRLRAGKWTEIIKLPNDSDSPQDFTVNLEVNMTDRILIRETETTFI